VNRVHNNWGEKVGGKKTVARALSTQTHTTVERGSEVGMGG